VLKCSDWARFFLVVGWHGANCLIAFDFTREAESAKQAIVSALEEVRRAIPTAQLLEVAPDFVGLTEIAELAGVTRQNMRKLSITHKDTFPIPMHEGSAALWHLPCTAVAQGTRLSHKPIFARRCPYRDAD
jgi:hypothetical protein